MMVRSSGTGADISAPRSRPSGAGALFIATKIECQPANNGHREVLAISSPEISQMIGSPAAADEEHHPTLPTFAQRRAAEFDPP
jgi:hypothetical protein